MGVQACRLPAPKPGKPSKPLKRLKPFQTLKTLPKRLGPDPLLFLTVQFAVHHAFAANLLFLTVQFAVHQAFAANRQPQATSMASYGRPSLPFASPQTPKTLQTPKTPKTLQTPKTPKSPKTLKALKIRRPRPLPRQGRRLGPPEVWNLALWSQAKAHAFPRQQLSQLHAPAIYIPLPSVFQGVQDCRLPGFKPSKPFRRPPRQQLLQPHAPAICFSGGSRLLFARLQTLQTLRRPFQGKTAVCPASNPPNAAAGLSKATTLSATCPCHLFFRASNAPNPSAGLQGNSTCPCHLFFRGFKTAVCPASNAPNSSAGLQSNNSYSYMPLPSVFQGVQDCRLPGFKPSKPFRRPPRQQLLQPHAPAICFSEGSRLPFARLQTLQTLPQAFPRQQLCQPHAPAICFSGGSRLPFARLQTLQTLPQASKATTLTATCPCHLFFRGFKTAVCPASNAPNPSAGLQGNNSYSYMPLPSIFHGVQDCRLPGFKRSKLFRGPPKQQLLQLHAPAICFSGLQTLQTLPRASKAILHAPAICFSGGSRLPFARLQTLQTLPRASKATTLTATCPCHLFFRGFKTAVCPASNAPNPSAGLQGNNSYSHMPLPSVFKGFKTAVCPASNPSDPSVFQGVQACCLPAFKPLKPLKPSKSLAAASTKLSGRKPLLSQRCSLPFACIALCC